MCIFVFSIINTSSTCMHNTVLENCVAEATSFVDKMMQKAMEKLVSFLKCQGNSHKKDKYIGRGM